MSSEMTINDYKWVLLHKSAFYIQSQVLWFLTLCFVEFLDSKHFLLKYVYLK